MKNCSNEAKDVIILFEKSLYGDLSHSRSSSTSSYTTGSGGTSHGFKSPPSHIINTNDTTIGTVLFSLKNYLKVDTFAEEFISYEGIQILVDVIQQSTGNIRVNF